MLFQQEVGDAFEHRHFDMDGLSCAIALAEGSERGIDGMKTGNLVCKGGRDETRALISINLWQQHGRAGQPLDEIIIGRATRIRPLRAEADAMNIDNIRLDLLHFLKSEAKTGDSIGANVVDENIARLYQLSDGGLAFIGFHVPNHRALAAVHGQVTRPHALGVGGLSNITEIVTLLRLNLHDLSAHVCQGLRAVRAEDDRRHVGDAQVRQNIRCGHVVSSGFFLLIMRLSLGQTRRFERLTDLRLHPRLLMRARQDRVVLGTGSAGVAPVLQPGADHAGQSRRDDAQFRAQTVRTGNRHNHGCGLARLFLPCDTARQALCMGIRVFQNAIERRDASQKGCRQNRLPVPKGRLQEHGI